MKRAAFFTGLKITGVILFCAGLLITILFAQGYQYNPLKKEIEKKSVIRLDAPAKSTVLVDGLSVEVSFPVELRVAPGIHEIEISLEGFLPWKRRVAVLEDSVVRFPEIRLLPQKGISKRLEKTGDYKLLSATPQFIAMWSPFLHITKKYKFSIDAVPSVEEQIELVESGTPAIKPLEQSGKIRWMSRVENTFHILALTDDLRFLYCDEDFQNCNLIAKLDNEFVVASEDKAVFFAVSGGYFTLFDFSKRGVLDQFLRNLRY